MKPTPLLTGWTCRHLGDTAPGKTVTLPHDAMLAEPRTALSAGGTNTGWYEGYDYEYRRTLTVPGAVVFTRTSTTAGSSDRVRILTPFSAICALLAVQSCTGR